MFILFPYRDDNPTKNFPTVTLSIIAANLIVFFIFGLSPDYSKIFIPKYGFIPNQFSLLKVFFSIFLHINFLHLAMNMWFLWLFGNNLEDKMGKPLFTGFYLTAGIFSFVVHKFTANSVMADMPCIGASGAIGAVMGGYILMFTQARIRIFMLVFVFARTFTLSAFAVLGFWFAQQLLFAALTQEGLSGIAYGAHIGGFVYGFIFLGAVKERLMPSLGDTNHLESLDHSEVDQSSSLSGQVDNKNISEKRNTVVSNIETSLKEKKFGQAIEEYVTKEEELSFLELSGDYQFDLAGALAHKGFDLHSVVACERYLKKYPKAKVSNQLKLYLGVVYVDKLKCFKKGHAYIKQVLSSGCDIANKKLFKKALSCLKQTSLFFQEVNIAAKNYPFKKGKFAILFNHEKIDSEGEDKIFKAFQAIGEINGKNMGIKLAYNFKNNCTKKNGTLLTDIDYSELEHAIGIAKNLKIKVIIIDQADYFTFPVIKSLSSYGVNGGVIEGVTEEKQKIKIELKDIVFIQISQLPYFVFRNSSQSKGLFEVDTTEVTEFDAKIDEMNVNRIIDLYTLDSRVRLTNRYYPVDPKEIDSKFEAITFDQVARRVFYGSPPSSFDIETIDFAVTNSWKKLNHMNAQNLNTSGMSKFRLKVQCKKIRA